jgi:hypothetical protein
MEGVLAGGGQWIGAQAPGPAYEDAMREARRREMVATRLKCLEMTVAFCAGTNTRTERALEIAQMFLDFAAPPLPDAR